MLVVYQILFSVFLSRVFKHYDVDVETIIALHTCNKIEKTTLYK